MGKFFVILGAVLIILGLLISFNAPIPFGKLPGDFAWKGKNVQIYFPLASSLILSLLLSFLFYFFFSRNS